MSSSSRSNKGKGKRKERDEQDGEQDGDATPEQDGDVTPENENENDILRRYYLRKRQATGSSRFQQSEGGTPNSIVTNHILTPRELDYPLKSDISVSLVVENGEYNLKLTSVPTDNKMTQHAHNAALLLSQGELLCKLGHKLLSELGAHHESKTYRTLNL